jgi:hypothetical protein
MIIGFYVSQTQHRRGLSSLQLAPDQVLRLAPHTGKTSDVEANQMQKVL